MASPRRIDVHFHLIPPFYSEAVYAAGRGPAIGKYPDWKESYTSLNEALIHAGVANDVRRE